MEELLEDSRDEEEMQLIGQGDEEVGGADPRASSRARTKREQLSALMRKQGGRRLEEVFRNEGSPAQKGDLGRTTPSGNSRARTEGRMQSLRAQP